MNKNIISLSNALTLRDPRYGTVFAMDIPGAVPLHKLDLAYATIDPDATSPNHYHKRTEEIYAITEGEGVMTIEGVSTPIKAGDVIRIPTWTTHSVRAGSSGLRLIVVTSPPYTGGDDHETDAVMVNEPMAGASVGYGAPTIAVIIGTHRAASVSARIARQVVSMYTDLGVTTDLIDLAALPVELFGPSSYEHRYDPDQPLARRFIDASALHFIVPEYNGSFPGPLKHALDVVPYKACFENKPVAMIGVAAGEWGGIRALEQLAQVFAYRNAHVFGRRVFIKEVDEAAVDAQGHLSNPEITDRMLRQISGFVEFVRRLSLAARA